MSDISFPYKTPALQIQQRIGVFYAVVLPAELLLQVATSDKLHAVKNESEEGYTLEGIQRPKIGRRLKEISDYINRDDSVFPNSIVLAVNHSFDHDSPKKWEISKSKDHCMITIPSPEQSASVIDGQHRLFAFTEATNEVVKNTHLLCSVFF